MKKYQQIAGIFLAASVLGGCQNVNRVNYEYGYVSPAGYAGNNPYWNNNYRLNTSNYYGNREQINSVGIFNQGRF